jgi:hypothetical protein
VTETRTGAVSPYGWSELFGAVHVYSEGDALKVIRGDGDQDAALARFRREVALAQGDEPERAQGLRRREDQGALTRI